MIAINNNQKRLCKICGEYFIANVHNQLYCSKKCKIKNDNKKRNKNIKQKPRNTFTYICSYCGKTLPNRHKSRSENQFCNADCRNAFHKDSRKIAQCLTCKSEFLQKHKNHLYCSNACKPSKRKSSTYKCDNCEKIFVTQEKRAEEHKFCDRNCYKEFLSKNKLIKQCEVCGGSFQTQESLNQRFCSIGCQGRWQSIFRTGVNSPTYKHEVSIEDRTIECEMCSKKVIALPCEIDKKRFCSSKCSHKWLTIETMKTLEEGNITIVNSKPQQIINRLLDSIGVKYQNEFNAKYYSVDNYLTEHHLFIEVMGDYWHCNHIKYTEVLNKKQKDAIVRDKRKRTYLLNKYGIKTLYLWEHDIYNNIDVCEKLIVEYIKNYGKLLNYHSFNYFIDNSELSLKNNVEIPYMDYKNDDILKIYKVAN